MGASVGRPRSQLNATSPASVPEGKPFQQRILKLMKPKGKKKAVIFTQS
jgi:hypothetical protein